MVASHHSAFAAASSSSSNHNHNSGERDPAEWMREACNFLNTHETDYDDGASEISAVHGSDYDSENDHDEYDDDHRMNVRRNGSGSGKPPTQDRATGESMIDALLLQSNNTDKTPLQSSTTTILLRAGGESPESVFRVADFG